MRTGSPAVLDPHRPTFVLICQLAVLALSTSVSAYSVLMSARPERLVYPLCIWLLFLGAWSFVSWYLVSGRLFDVYALFLASVMLFSGGQAFLEVFHANSSGILQGWFANSTVTATLCIVIVAVSAMHLGALIGNLKVRDQYRSTQAHDRDPDTEAALRASGRDRRDASGDGCGGRCHRDRNTENDASAAGGAFGAPASCRQSRIAVCSQCSWTRCPSCGTALTQV